MDIETFVKETIIGIVKGVKGAQKECEGTGARINPRNIKGEGRGKSAGLGRPVTDVQFNVAVTAEDSVEGGGGIKVFAVSVGGKGATSSSEVSHVSFTVPVSWPCHDKDLEGARGAALLER